jgi:hypothetical protein
LGPGAARLAAAAGGGALLLWPTLLNGPHPYLFWDSYGYFTQGRDYWTLILASLGQGPVPPEAAAGWIGAAGRMLGYDPAIRSPTYSLLFWPLSVLGTFWLVAALTAAVALERLFGLGPRRRWAVLAGLAVASPLPWFASYAMPDLFGGLMVLAMATLAFAPGRLGAGERAGLAAMALLGASFHAANLPLAAGLVAAGTALAQGGRRLATAARLAAPALGAVLLLLALGWLGFGRPTLAPKGPPFLLARQVEDGPTIPYLREACPRGGGWALCPHLDSLWTNAQDFLWSERDSYWAWDEATRARLRAEEGRLVLRAALARPLLQLEASTLNALRQLARFGLDDLVLGRGAVVAPYDYWFAYRHEAPIRRIGVGPFEALIYMAAAFSLVALLWLAWPPEGDGRRRTLPRAAWFLLAGVALNAAVCGVLSGPHHRYQARVAWLLPLAAAGALLAARTGRGPLSPPEGTSARAGAPP